MENYQQKIPRGSSAHLTNLRVITRVLSKKRHALRQIRVPARLFESPRHSGATDEGVTPRLLSVRVPGACQDWRPTRRIINRHEAQDLRRKTRTPTCS